MTLPIPTANQPIDYDFINAITLEINRIAGEVAGLNKNSTSQINGNAISQSRIVMFGAEVQVLAPGTAAYSEVNVPFNGVSFKNAPIVTSTAKTNATTLTFTITATNVTSKGCNLNVIWGPTKPTNPITISVLAIGERAA
jgi:hypothetical protein